MRTFAYCALSFAQATRRAAGVEPATCPPLDHRIMVPFWFEDQDLLWFDLHGEPGEAAWRGDDGLVALTADQIREANLDGVVVFAASCYLAEDESPMLDALLDAGASYVIGGDGRNYAGRQSVFGAGLLGMWLRRWMALGLSPLRALALARQRIRISAAIGQYRQPAQDALEFRVYHRGKSWRST